MCLVKLALETIKRVSQNGYDGKILIIHLHKYIKQQNNSALRSETFFFQKLHQQSAKCRSQILLNASMLIQK